MFWSMAVTAQWHVCKPASSLKMHSIQKIRRFVCSIRRDGCRFLKTCAHTLNEMLVYVVLISCSICLVLSKVRDFMHYLSCHLVMQFIGFTYMHFLISSFWIMNYRILCWTTYVGILILQLWNTFLKISLYCMLYFSLLQRFESRKFWLWWKRFDDAFGV